MTDGELIQQLAKRSAGWEGVLGKLRSVHIDNLGRAIEPTQWVEGESAGIWSWFGYYWQTERFWFGYGLNRGGWQPIISADIRSRHAQSWLQLRSQLPSAWSAEVGGDFAFLWSSLADAEASAQGRWFHDRSMELHEYSLMER